LAAFEPAGRDGRDHAFTDRFEPLLAKFTSFGGVEVSQPKSATDRGGYLDTDQVRSSHGLRPLKKPLCLA
jgi:hypothetical protein